MIKLAKAGETIRLIISVLNSTKIFWLLASGIFTTLGLNAQELEPRALSNVPTKTNFAVTGYMFSQGDLLLDPAIPIEDVETKQNIAYLGYLRSFSLFGNSSKISLIVPGVDAFFEGNVEGQYQTRDLTGIADPSIIFSTNFIGSPAIKLSDFNSFKPNSIVGFSIKIKLPLGEYESDKLINIGSNRFVIKPQIGWSRTKGRWIFESYASVWFFTKNKDFFGGNTFAQNPLFGIKQHFIYTFKNKMWVTFDAGYAFGGRTLVNDEFKDTQISTFRLGSTISYPFAKGHSLKLTFNTGIRLKRGPKFNSLALTYVFRWFDKMK